MTLTADMGNGSNLTASIDITLTLTANIGDVDDTTYLQSLIDQKITVPARDYTINNSIKINASGTYDFESGVTITFSEGFADSDERNFTGKDRVAAFWVYANDVILNFNNTIINCNQDTILEQDKYTNCVIVYEVDNCYIEKLEGNNTHNTVLGSTATNLECNDLESSGNENIIAIDVDFVNCALDIQSCTGVTGSGFTSDGCEEVIDVNIGEDITLDTIYGTNMTEVVVEIGFGTNVTMDNITADKPTYANRLVYVYDTTNVALTNMQDNDDYSEPGLEESIVFYID